jgi:RecB family exonuclease
VNGDIARLAEEIAVRRQSDSWQTVTVLTPTQVSGLQARRQLVRHLGGVANIRWSTPELAVRPADWPSSIRLLAETWRAIQVPFAAWLAVTDPVELLQTAVPAMTRLREAEALPETLDSRVLAVFQDLESSLPSWRRLDAQRAEGIRFRCDDREPLTEPISTQLEVTFAPDAFEEVRIAFADIAAAIASGTPAYRIAVVIPDGFYGAIVTQTAAEVGILTNGFPSQPAYLTDGGRAMAAVPIENPEWTEIIDALKSAAEGDPDPVTRQALADRVADWDQLANFECSAPLVESLRYQLLHSRLPGGERFGDGVFVGRLDEFAGLDFDELIMVGFTDRAYPPGATQNVLLPRTFRTESKEAEYLFDRLRNRCLRTRVYVPHGDRKRGQAAFASPWLWPRIGDSSRDVPSRIARHAGIAGLTETDRAVADAVDRNPEGPVELRYARLQSGLPSEGLVRIDPTLMPARERGWSASALESYLTCPRRYYYQSVLRIPEITEEVEGLPADQRGLIAHSVLHRLFQARLTELASLQFAWTPDHEQSVKNWVSDEAEQRGFITAPQARDADQLAEELVRFLREDSVDRANGGWIPIQTEMKFETTIAGVRTRGTVDRLDKSIDSSALRVIDYKTGLVKKWKADDPTDGGRRVQWLLYSEAVQEGNDGAQVNARYWSLRDGSHHDLTYSSESRVALEESLVTADQMSAERLIPVRPSESTCSFCAYRAICPNDREQIWRAQREDSSPAYQRFLRLVKEDPEVADAS